MEAREKMWFTSPRKDLNFVQERKISQEKDHREERKNVC